MYLKVSSMFSTEVKWCNLIIMLHNVGHCWAVLDDTPFQCRMGGREQCPWTGTPGCWFPSWLTGECDRTILVSHYSASRGKPMPGFWKGAPPIQKEQCGYRPGRGLVDQRFTLSRPSLVGLRTQATEMCFLRRVAGPSLRERVRSSDIRRELGVETLLLRVESQLRWFGHLIRRARPTGRRPRGRDYISQLAWERLGIP